MIGRICGTIVSVMIFAVSISFMLPTKSAEAFTQLEAIELSPGDVLMTCVDSRPVTVIRTWGNYGDLLVRDSLTLQKVRMGPGELRYPKLSELSADATEKRKNTPRRVVVNTGGGCFISIAGIAEGE